MPIGRDYNTDKSTRDMTRPSVSTKLFFPPYPLSLPKTHLVLLWKPEYMVPTVFVKLCGLPKL